ncbi:MAG: MFS transporter [Candidatus Korobacteraceae bacterium]|jgi:sugar phosphate permease
MPIQGTTPQSVSDKATRQRFVIVAVLFVGIMVTYLDRVNVSVLAASNSFLLDMSIKGQPMKVGMMMSVFLAVYGVATLILSPLGDYFGPRKVAAIALALCCVSLVIGGAATGFAVLIASRVLLGIGEAVHYPMQNLFVANWFPPQERGRANATWVIGQSLAPAIAMPLFTYVIGTFGWRQSFHMATGLTLIPLYLFWFHTTDTPRGNRRVNARELQHIEGGVTQKQEGGVPVAEEPLWQRLRPFVLNYRYWLLVYWQISMAFMYWGMVAWLPSYLRSARGFSWAQMGWLASLPFVLAATFKVFTGWINDRMGRSAPILTLALSLGGLGIYFAAIVPGKYASALLLACAFATTLMATSVAWTLLQGLVPRKSLATAGGVLIGVSQGVASLSPALMGLVIDLTGRYEGGLFLIAGAGVIAAAATTILVFQKY